MINRIISFVVSKEIFERYHDYIIALESDIERLGDANWERVVPNIHWDLESYKYRISRNTLKTQVILIGIPNCEEGLRHSNLDYFILPEVTKDQDLKVLIAKAEATWKSKLTSYNSLSGPGKVRPSNLFSK